MPPFHACYNLIIRVQLFHSVGLIVQTAIEFHRLWKDTDVSIFQIFKLAVRLPKLETEILVYFGVLEVS